MPVNEKTCQSSLTRCVVKVPASSANLGPGFDVFAAAVAIYTEVEVVKTGKFALHTDLAIASNRRNLSVRGFEKFLPVDEFEFHIRSDIPLVGGLGGSAAAVVAGLVAGRAMAGQKGKLLELATELEGHPDNVAAALCGGIVISSGEKTISIAVPKELRAVVVIPHKAVRTRQARAALPTEVPLADASFNIAHGSALALGLEREDFELIAYGLADRLHQTQRASLFPRSAELVQNACEYGALGATISGAGPTVLMWTTKERKAELVGELTAETERWADVQAVDFARKGAKVIETE